MPKAQLLIFILLLQPKVGLSQTQTTAHHHRAAKIQPSSSTTKYLTEPFDITTSNLGPSFRGHDIAAIWKTAVAKEPPGQSEFETSSQYSVRMARLERSALVGSVTSDDYLAFVVEKPDYAAADPDEETGTGSSFGGYNADKQLFEVRLFGMQHCGIRFEYCKKDAISTHSVKVARRFYEASNAFGAKINVTETDYLKYGLVFEPVSWVFPERTFRVESRSFAREISMVPEKARLFLPNARVLVICKLTHDHWAFHSEGGQVATFDSPESTNIEKYYIHVKPEQIWVIDGSTGDVIRKFSEASNASDTAAGRPLPLKKFPLVVQLSMRTALDDQLTDSVFVTVDDGEEKPELFSDQKPIFYAYNKVRLSWLMPPEDLSRLILNVNGTPFVPKWQRRMAGTTLIGASAVITVGN